MTRGCTSEDVGGGRSGEAASGGGQRPSAVAISGEQGTQEGREEHYVWGRWRAGRLGRELRVGAQTSRMGTDAGEGASRGGGGTQEGHGCRVRARDYGGR
jgi:hypothetical protein